MKNKCGVNYSVQAQKLAVESQNYNDVFIKPHQGTKGATVLPADVHFSESWGLQSRKEAGSGLL